MMNPEKLRAWWFHKQGLDGTPAGRDCAAVLDRSGWARSVGGAGPYLSLYARAGTPRQVVDGAVAKLEIHELPSARGCTYVVPANDFALALTVGQGFGGELKTAQKLGVTEAEVERLCRAVTDALANGPKDPEELRAAVGAAARSLGPEGVKRGLSSTMPVALGILQAAGEIRRVPVDGRLDRQRYRYALWRPNPLSQAVMSKDEAYTELARRFFAWTGPATPAEFQWFSGLGVKAAKAAIAPLGLAPLGDSDGRLMFPDDREALESFRVPAEHQYVLLSSLDAITQLRRDLRSLIAPEDAGTMVHVDKSAEALGGLTDLPSHGIFDRGRLIGLWEYDVEKAAIAWTVFAGKPDAALREAVGRTEEYVRTELGDARSFSLDSPKSRAPRIEALRKAAAGTA